MSRLVWGFVLLLVLAPGAALAQTPGAAASPAPASYNDPAMAFIAPPGYERVPIPAPKDYTNFDGPTVVAAFVKDRGKEDQRLIIIEMESFPGSLDGYEGTVQNQIRSSQETVFVDKKEATQLSNGMPAYFVAMNMGSGFQAVQRYQYEWIDGVRGVTVAIQSRIGGVTEQEAKAALRRLTAVAYPANQP